ncbi:MAG: IS200/IS605 family transposase [Bacteroidales bacterium]
MSSYRQLLYHIVFRTKNSQKVLTQEYSKELYAYMAGIIKNKDCFLYRINGVENHIHILCDIYPKIAFADFVRDIKSNSSKWLKENRNFPNFDGWADGYGGFSISYKDKDVIINYIKNQQTHHQIVTFEQEYRRLLEEFGIEIDERYFP